MRKLIFTIVLAFSALAASAQRVSFGTNLMEWANLGTINAELGVAVSRHCSIIAGGRYNGWSFNTRQYHQILQNQQATGYVGARWWPWYVNSGWWLEGKAQYSKIQRSGIFRPAMLHQADMVGAAFSFGYALMLNEHWNVDFGIGLWGGVSLNDKLYECPVCMRPNPLPGRKDGTRGFIDLNDIKISFSYVFGGKKKEEKPEWGW